MMKKRASVALNGAADAGGTASHDGSLLVRLSVGSLEIFK